MKRISHSYFVVMIDHGSKGLEAVVDPEVTRRGVVDMLKSGERKHIVFIHHVDGLYVEDVTDELFDEAEAELRTFSRPDELDRQAADFDRARDYRKHETV